MITLLIYTVLCRVSMQPRVLINTYSSYSSSAPPYFGFPHQGSPQRIFHLQLFLSSVSSSVPSTAAMSSVTTSKNLLFGLPRFLFPGSSILSIRLVIYPLYTLHTFTFTLAGTRLSQITPDILLHPFHPACTLFFTFLPHSPVLCTVEPRYLKSSTIYSIL